MQSVDTCRGLDRMFLEPSTWLDSYDCFRSHNKISVLRLYNGCKGHFAAQGRILSEPSA
jgi:hypothetical protein